MILFCADGEIGRRTRFKIVRTFVHEGSSPSLRILEDYSSLAEEDALEMR